MVTKKPQRCKVEGCNRIINTKRTNKSGFCSYHYGKNKRRENGWYKRRMVEDDTLLNYKDKKPKIKINKMILECPNCKTKFDISGYTNNLKEKFFKEIEKIIKEIKNE